MNLKRYSILSNLSSNIDASITKKLINNEFKNL